ncbi:MAG: hypothetical protein KF752_03025 [Pirellulaceae bacterium]|nr:hypothetical protein [Pirellulaceae bacterium]
MNHATISRATCTLLVVCLCGCAILAMSGCRQDNPGSWPVERVTAKVAESLGLSDLNLQNTERGLEGTGKRADGELLKLTVTQHPDEHAIRWEATGDRGFVEEGSYQLK